MERNTPSRSDELESGSRLSFNRRTVLTTAGTAVLGLGAVGVFSGTAAAWDSFEVDFKGCSSVWFIVSQSDLDYIPPVFVKVIVEDDDGNVVCRKQEFSDETATTIPGQHGDKPVVKFDGGGDKILAVIKYNDKEEPVPFCYVENTNQCAQTPNVADWRDADCYKEMPQRYQDVLCDSTPDGNGNGNGNGKPNNP